MSSKWIKYRLEELGNIVTGKTPPSKVGKAYSMSGVPFVTPRDMNGRRWIDSTERHLSDLGVSAVAKSLVPANSLAVSCIGSVGKPVLLKSKSVTNQQINTLVVDTERFNPKFIYYILLTKQDALKRIAGGSVVPILNKGHFGKFEISLPAKEEQDSLVQCLDSLDSKSEINTQTNQTLEQIAQAIFKSWFVDFEPVKAKMAVLEAGGTVEQAELAAMSAISSKDEAALKQLQAEQPDAYAELAQTAALFPSAMEESELGGIPEGWDVKSLSSLTTLTGGGTPKRSESEYWNGNTPWFSVKDVPADGNVFVIDTEEKITEHGLKKSSTKLLKKGTTIITARGTVGKLALLATDMCMNQSCYGVNGKDTGQYFNYFYLKESVDTLKRNTHGAVFDTITTNTFDTYRASFCGEGLAGRFENIVTPLLGRIESNLRENQSLNMMRDTLLPKLLTGGLPITNTEVAP